jgi:hypothetical protein
MLVVRSAGAGDDDKPSSPKDTDAEGKPTKPQEEETLVRHGTWEGKEARLGRGWLVAGVGIPLGIWAIG